MNSLRFKSLPALLALLSLAFSLPAAAQRIRSVDVKVFINADGDAYVKQVWDVNVVSGTEWYIPIGNLGKMTVGGLEVSENGVTFIDEERSWDSNRSMEQKAGRSGIIDKGKDGVELCWGQGSYGDHVWTVGFVILDLVQSLEDYDAFNFMFINPDLVAPVEHATVTFKRLGDEPFDFDYTRFWFFGTEGDSQLREDGAVFFETSGLMRRSDSVICMMRFDKGHFSPGVEREMKFEKMQNQAFKGSSYSGGGKSLGDWVAIIIAFGFVALIGLGILALVFLFLRDVFLRIFGLEWSPKFFGRRKVTGWAREAPFGGSIPTATYLLCEGTGLMLRAEKPEEAIGAFFMKWIAEGLLVPAKNSSGGYNLSVATPSEEFSSESEKRLFSIVKSAAGDNGILEKDEFTKWAKEHYLQVTRWPGNVKSEGKNEYRSFAGDKIAEGAKLLQFKNFLNEFTLSREREVPEVSLWGQYLVFAQLFGIADKVSKGLANLYPQKFSEFSSMYGLDSSSMSTIVRDWSRNSHSFYSSANSEKLSRESSRSSGSSGGFGGYSSRGGGGGFSGGGHGGGSR